MICPNCGREPGIEGIEYCPYCGAPVKNGRPRVTGWFKAALAALLCILLLGGLVLGLVLLAGKYLKSAEGSEDKVETVTLSVSEHEGLFYPGDSALLSAAFFPELRREPGLSWSSTDESVVTVDGTGRISIIAEGEAEVIAALKNGKYGRFSVSAQKKPELLTIGTGELTLKKGQTYGFEAAVAPSGAAYESIRWTSSDPKVLEVDENGAVKAVGHGKATVTAELDCGVKASAGVFVYEFGFDILGDRLERIGEVDMYSRCYYFELEHEQEEEQNGLVIHKYTELIWYPQDEVISLCCDVYDEELNMYYELMADIYRDERYNAYIWFTSSSDGSANSHTTPLASSGLSDIEAGGGFYLPNYYPGSRSVFQWYEGDEEFRDAAQQIADDMLEYAMITLRDNWEKVGLEQSYKEILYLEML